MAIRLLWRAFSPMILRWLGKKAMEKVQNSFERRTGFNTRPPDGKTKVHRKPQSSERGGRAKTENPKSKKVVGEYVDFEEID